MMEETPDIKKSSDPSNSKLRAASHDLNNLLNNILSSSELLKDRIGDDITLLQLIKQIELSSIFATDIVNQLFRKPDLSCESKINFDLQEIVAEAIQITDRSNRDKINFEFDDNDHTVFGNPIDIKKAVLNILLNAKEAGSEEIVINVNISRIDDENIKLSIFDNGQGIPQDILNHIFDEGFSTKDSSTNRGIGLSIVKSILDKHKSIIDVQSELGTGTTFNLVFKPAIKINNDLNNKKVIIAEDDQFQREVLKDLVKTMKIQVFTASNGVEALDLFLSEKPDLLFIDESMPQMSGMECSKKIRELDKNSPIVLVTGLNVDKNDLDDTVTRVLKKPYNFETVKNTLTELL